MQLFHLDLGLQMCHFLFLANNHLLVIVVVHDIDTNTKLIPKLVDTCTLCANDTPDILLFNVKLGGLFQQPIRAKLS